MWCGPGRWEDSSGDWGRRETIDGRGPDAPETRIGDAERNATTEALTEHYAAGRLDSNELEDRMEEVNTARYQRDLDHALRDLPRLRAPRTARRDRAAGVGAGLGAGMAGVAGMLLPLLAVMAVISWFALIGPGFFGFLFFFWFGLPLLGRIAGGGRRGWGPPHGGHRGPRQHYRHV